MNWHFWQNYRIWYKVEKRYSSLDKPLNSDYQEISSPNHQTMINFDLSRRILELSWYSDGNTRNYRMKYCGWNTPCYLQIKKDYIRKTPRVESKLGCYANLIWNFFTFLPETLSFSLNTRKGREKRTWKFIFRMKDTSRGKNSSNKILL